MAREQPPAEPNEPEPLPGEQEPGWVAGLRNSMAELGRRLDGLNANVSDDDRRSIAESVHGLFESSGAFIKVDEGEGDGDQEQDDDAGASAESAPPAPEKRTLAEKWFGRY